MSTSTFSCHFSTKEQTIYQGQATEVLMPGAQGQFGILTGHTNMIAELAHGKIIIRTVTENKAFFISKGIAHFIDGKLIVLAEQLIDPGQLKPSLVLPRDSHSVEVLGLKGTNYISSPDKLVIVVVHCRKISQKQEYWFKIPFALLQSLKLDTEHLAHVMVSHCYDTGNGEVLNIDTVLPVAIDQDAIYIKVPQLYHALILGKDIYIYLFSDWN